MRMLCRTVRSEREHKTARVREQTSARAFDGSSRIMKRSVTRRSRRIVARFGDIGSACGGHGSRCLCVVCLAFHTFLIFVGCRIM